MATYDSIISSQSPTSSESSLKLLIVNAQGPDDIHRKNTQDDRIKALVDLINRERPDVVFFVEFAWRSVRERSWKNAGLPAEYCLSSVGETSKQACFLYNEDKVDIQLDGILDNKMSKDYKPLLSRSCEIKIKWENKELVCISWHGPHSKRNADGKEALYTLFKQYLLELLQNQIPFIVGGDFNLDIHKLREFFPHPLICMKNKSTGRREDKCFFIRSVIKWMDEITKPIALHWTNITEVENAQDIFDHDPISLCLRCSVVTKIIKATSTCVQQTPTQNSLGNENKALTDLNKIYTERLEEQMQVYEQLKAEYESMLKENSNLEEVRVKYQQLKEEHESMRTEHTHLTEVRVHYEHLKEEHESLKKENSTLNEVRVHYEHLKEEHESLKKENSTLNEVIIQYAQLKEENRSLKKEKLNIKEVKDKYEQLKKDHENVKKEISYLKETDEKYTNLGQKHQALQNKLGILQKERNDVIKCNKILNDKHSAVKNDYEGLNSEHEKLKREIDIMKKSLVDETTNHATLKTKCKRIEEDNIQMKNKLQQMKETDEKYKNLGQEHQALQNALGILKKERNDIIQHNKILKDKHSALMNDYEALNTEHEKLKREIDIMKKASRPNTGRSQNNEMHNQKYLSSNTAGNHTSVLHIKPHLNKQPVSFMQEKVASTSDQKSVQDMHSSLNILKKKIQNMDVNLHCSSKLEENKMKADMSVSDFKNSGPTKHGLKQCKKSSLNKSFTKQHQYTAKSTIVKSNHTKASTLKTSTPMIGDVTISATETRPAQKIGVGNMTSNESAMESRKYLTEYPTLKLTAKFSRTIQQSSQLQQSTTANQKPKLKQSKKSNISDTVTNLDYRPNLVGVNQQFQISCGGGTSVANTLQKSGITKISNTSIEQAAAHNTTGSITKCHRTTPTKTQQNREHAAHESCTPTKVEKKDIIVIPD